MIAMKKYLFVMSLITTVLGIGTILFVWLRQSSLPPGAARSQLWTIGITGHEGYSYAGLEGPLMAGSDIFIIGLIIFSIGIGMLGVWWISRR
jgi:hypothetical protein